MNLVSHLVDTDVRRFRLALIAWAIIVAAAALAYGVRPALPDGDQFSSLMSFLAVVVWIGGLFFMLGVTAQVVQSDSLVGTNAFWMTRPIPPLSLLSAKAILIGAAMVVLPVVADVLLMASHDVAPGTMGVVALQAVVAQMFWLVIAMSYATLTVGVAQFFLLCGATPLAIAFVLLFVEYAIAPLLDSWPRLSAFEETRAGTLFVGLAIVAAACLLATMYRTRSRRRAIAFGVALILAALVLPEFVPQPPAVNAAPEWATRLGALTADLHFERPAANANETVLQGRVFTTGLPRNWSATIALRGENSLSFDTITTNARPAYTLGFVDGSNAPAVWEVGALESSTIAALKAVLGVASIRGLPPDSAEPGKPFATTIRDPDSDPEPTRRYRARVTLSFVERSVAAVLPLERGAVFNDGVRRASILAVDLPDDSDRRLTLSVRESIAKTVLRPDDALTFEAYLRNRSTSEAAFGTNPFQPFGDNFSTSMLMPVPIVADGHPFGFHVGQRRYQFPSFYAAAAGAVRLDESWRTGAELVIVRVRHAGSIDRVLETPVLPAATSEKR